MFELDCLIYKLDCRYYKLDLHNKQIKVRFSEEWSWQPRYKWQTKSLALKLVCLNAKLVCAGYKLEMVEYEEEEAPSQRVNSDEIIRFQDKVNILGEKKYIKIKNPVLEKEDFAEEEEDTVYEVSIKI